GKGKMRGRRYRIPKSILIVSLKEGLQKSSENLSGVDITKPQHLNIELLAPGGIAGRLTVFTKSALTKLGGAK
ncbi:MAG TPA: 50S ribosomal protein L4, partial [Thermoplasmata archaeon]|nr:50S ribosomal protein L4 [Thermoplasmata archaeon]